MNIDNLSTNYSTIQHTIQANDLLGENAAILPFVLKEDLLFRVDHDDWPYRLCVPTTCLKDLFDLLHEGNHIGFAKMHDLVITSFYVWHLKFHLHEYLLPCPQCLVFQTRRHSPYGSLQPIESPPVPFHT